MRSILFTAALAAISINLLPGTASAEPAIETAMVVPFVDEHGECYVGEGLFWGDAEYSLIPIRSCGTRLVSFGAQGFGNGPRVQGYALTGTFSLDIGRSFELRFTGGAASITAPSGASGGWSLNRYDPAPSDKAQWSPLGVVEGFYSLTYPTPRWRYLDLGPYVRAGTIGFGGSVEAGLSLSMLWIDWGFGYLRLIEAEGAEGRFGANCVTGWAKIKTAVF